MRYVRLRRDDRDILLGTTTLAAALNRVLAVVGVDPGVLPGRRRT